MTPSRACEAVRFWTHDASFFRVQFDALGERTEVIAAATACRRLKRKNGGLWRAQFCTEVARPKRFELQIRS
jgi:hypothetical protein